ncbi:type VII secretion protein EssB [Ornithinibacillus xuwenensis]|uniref:Type VII secretion protein EssB n=1 Tax=Ornithinibacillus xuwenensis TaxID=3144668 RepID=A0ABU9XL43_9BACI
MQEKTIQIDKLRLQVKMDKDSWQFSLPKSETSMKSVRQLDLIKDPSDYFLPLSIEEQEDLFIFHMSIDPAMKRWEQVKKLNRNDKLRLLCNVAQLERFLSTRITFFLHPDNLVFDDNLMPKVVYRGIRNVVPPYEMDEEVFLRQFKCLIIALFSKKYDFEQLYNGSLNNAKETEFERQVSEVQDLSALYSLLVDSYKKEKKKVENTMVLVSTKRFRLFKQLSIIMIIVSVLLAAPLVYYGFVKSPYQETLLDAHGEYLASNYGNVISTLQDEDPEKLPDRTKYILSHSYISVEKLSDSEKETIMKNVSLRSDTDYLLYWIYNGRGEFEKSIEKAKYLDDPQLIMYGLIKQIEQAKNNPNLTGTERDETVRSLQEELDRYREEYNLGGNEDSTGDPVTETEQSENTDSTSTEEVEEGNETSNQGE